MIGAGNDQQFQTLCNKVLGRPDIAVDVRYRTNSVRVENRASLIEEISKTLKEKSRSHWIDRFTGLRYVLSPFLTFFVNDGGLAYRLGPLMILSRHSTILK